MKIFLRGLSVLYVLTFVAASDSRAKSLAKFPGGHENSDNKEITEATAQAGYSSVQTNFFKDLADFIKCPSPRSVKTQGMPKPEVEVAELGPMFKNMRTQMIKSKALSKDLLPGSTETHGKVNGALLASQLKIRPQDLMGSVTPPNKLYDLTNALGELTHLNTKAVKLCNSVDNGKSDVSLTAYLESCKTDPKIVEQMKQEWQAAWNKYKASFKVVYNNYDLQVRKDLCKDVKSNFYDDSEKRKRVSYNEAEAKNKVQELVAARKAGEASMLSPVSDQGDEAKHQEEHEKLIAPALTQAQDFVDSENYGEGIQQYKKALSFLSRNVPWAAARRSQIHTDLGGAMYKQMIKLIAFQNYASASDLNAQIQASDEFNAGAKSRAKKLMDDLAAKLNN